MTHVESGSAAPTVSPIGVLRASVRTYRLYPRQLLILAIVVMIPAEMIVNFFQVKYTVAEGADIDVGRALMALMTVLLISVGSQWGELFYSGMVDHVVAAHRHGHAAPTLRRMFFGIPYLTLFLAETLVTILVGFGWILFVIPGFVLMVLFAAVGPLVMIENRKSWRSIWRSASLVRHAFWRVAVLIVGVSLLSEGLEELVHLVGHDFSEIGSYLLEAVVIVVIAPLSGLTRVHLTHDLLEMEAARSGQPIAASAEIAGDPEDPDVAGDQVSAPPN